jgi:quercetin dioxygenase-like cupin family protein
MFSVFIVGAAAYWARVLATTESGFTSTTLTVGRFGDIDVSNHVLIDKLAPSGHGKDVWVSWQKTTGPSDLHVQSNLWAPGGTTGWHTHPGHSLIIVTAGTVTAYEGDDPCTPHAYTVGMGFVDPGGDHVHVLRNEDSVEARTIAVQLIPAGAGRRVDAARPGGPPILRHELDRIARDCK